MRLIGVIDDAKQAQELSAFLLTEGIENRVDLNDDSKSEVWVKDEDQFQDALAAFGEHQANPNDAKYASAVDGAIQLLKQQQRKARSIKKNIVKVQHRSTQTTGPVVKTIIGLSILVAVLTNFGAPQSQEQGANRALQFVAVDKPLSTELAAQYGNVSDDINMRLASLKRGEFWRLVTPIFIHYGAMHIVFNVLMFFQFGKLIEGRYGSLWMAILILVCAVLSNFAQGVVPVGMGGSSPYYYQSGMLITSFGGLSGVVFGMFGFILVKQMTDSTSGFYLPQSTIIILLVYMVFCMTPIASEVFGLHVANWAHGIGFVVGCALAQVKR
jgi:GlpG protein